MLYILPFFCMQLMPNKFMEKNCQSCWPLDERSCFSLTFRGRKVFVFVIKETFYFSLFRLLRIC